MDQVLKEQAVAVQHPDGLSVQRPVGGEVHGDFTAGGAQGVEASAGAFVASSVAPAISR